MLSRLVRAQPALSLITASLWFALCYALFFPGLHSSDGTNYATVARNLEQGKGLMSSVIQPGLMKLTPTTSVGQAYVTQAPLWPVVLAAWFRIFGASDWTVSLLCGLLGALCAWVAFLLGRSIHQSAAEGWLAVALLLTNPHWMGSIMAAYNVGLQSLIIGGLFLIMLRRPSVGSAVLAGLLLGAGLVTRENTIVVAGGLAAAWLIRPPDLDLASGFVRRCIRVAPFLAVVLVIAGGISLAESARKASVLGRWDSPTLRMTFLYWTPVFDLGWYFIYDFAGARIDPLTYFLQNPGILLEKIWFQFRVLFLKETVPALMSFNYGLVPVLAPWLLPTHPGRTLGFGLLACLGCQLAIGLPTFLHVHYFVAFLPVIVPIVVATAMSLLRRMGETRTPTRRFLLSAFALYALLPLPLNSGALLSGRGIPTGEMPITEAQAKAFAAFVQHNTDPDEVVVVSHSPLMAWRTGRTILQYSGHPDYRISGGPMWQRVEEQLPIDVIVLNSLAFETGEENLPKGFSLAKTLEAEGFKAWLFRRPIGTP